MSSAISKTYRSVIDGSRVKLWSNNIEFTEFIDISRSTKSRVVNTIH